MEEGYLAIILNAHLPYVKHPEYEESLEENWLYEAITDTYIPLIVMLDDLMEDEVDFRLTFSLSPTLISMLLDPFLQSRYMKRLERLIELAEKEIKRTNSQPEFNILAQMYCLRFIRSRDLFINRYDRNLIQALRRLQDSGKIEIMASAATHSYLPTLSLNSSAVRSQIRVGIDYYEKVFGHTPKGFWLPECGYYPGLDNLLREHGIRFTILETHGITHAVPRPVYGVYAPVCCHSGVVAFGRDPDSSRQVWSSIEGYPGDFDYREFYRDIAYDLDLEYIKPYTYGEGIRTDTGIKYFRITGAGNHKEAYIPGLAERKAEMHAEDFIFSRTKQINNLNLEMDRKPLIVAPYDAELFGHWWFEGPTWLSYLLRKIGMEHKSIRLITPYEYISEYPSNQLSTPSMSSWGRNGYSEVWINDKNDWILPHLEHAARKMESVSRLYPTADRLSRRAIDQAMRELMLAQSSDWQFMIYNGTTSEYAINRIKNHLLEFHRLCNDIENNTIDEENLLELESRNSIFPDLRCHSSNRDSTVLRSTRALK